MVGNFFPGNIGVWAPSELATERPAPVHSLRLSHQLSEFLTPVNSVLNSLKLPGLLCLLSIASTWHSTIFFHLILLIFMTATSLLEAFYFFCLLSCLVHSSVFELGGSLAGKLQSFDICWELGLCPAMKSVSEMFHEQLKETLSCFLGTALNTHTS